jgi:NTP pyrophosphatase (non-canonical NTP hydrolase)
MGQTPQRRLSLPSSGDPFWDLVATAKRLQAPGGCQWDHTQTVSSLLPCLIEEVWEVFEAARSQRHEDLQEELGDVLYTVLFLTLIAERQGWCTLEALLTATREKMVRRHPHVFGVNTAATPREAYQRWQASKRLEGRRRHSPSNAFRDMLVAWWEWLHAHPDADLRPPLSGQPRSAVGSPPVRVEGPSRQRRRGRATRTMKRKANASGPPTQPSAMPAQARGQSQGRARSPERVD